MKKTLMSMACALSAPALLPAATTVVDLNGGFNTVQGTGTLSAAGGLATSFGTISSFGLNPLNSLTTPGDRPVLSFAAVANNTQGLSFVHGTPTPNTTGFSLLMDVYFPALSSSGFTSLLQLETSTSADGELFIRSSDNAIGRSTYGGTFTTGVWQRVVLTVDAAHTQFNAYIEGNLAVTRTFSGSDPARYALSDPSFLVFGDEDGETAPGYIATFAFTDSTLSALEVAAFGRANGVPEPAGALLLGLAGAAAALRRRTRG